MKHIKRSVGVVGVAFRQLIYNRARTALAVFGIVMAVLSVTLLLGVGAGVLATGEELADDTGRDLWVSGGPVEINPQMVGGFQNPIVDSHELADDLETHDGVDTAVPMAFNAVYVSTDGDDFETVMGVGVTGGGPAVEIAEGDGFSGNDTHRVDGEYDGPMNHEVIIGPALADEYDLEPGDTFHVGGTLRNAEENEFTVVGISTTFEDLTGTNAVTVRLSDLQTLTGMTFNDRSSLITVTLTDNAQQEVVKDDLETQYPDLDVRTNREQITEMFERQALILAGGVSLSLLALLSGVFFSLNLVLSLVYQQRKELAMFRAVGGSRYSLTGIALVQTMGIALVGGALGLLLTPVAAGGLERTTVAITGFEGLVQVPPEAYGLAIAITVFFTVIGTLAAVWRLSRHEIAELLEANDG